jgi:hypothetical protein
MGKKRIRAASHACETRNEGSDVCCGSGKVGSVVQKGIFTLGVSRVSSSILLPSAWRL